MKHVHQAAGAIKTKIDKFVLTIVKIGEYPVAGTSPIEIPLSIG